MSCQRRVVAPPDQLKQYSASPIYRNNHHNNNLDENGSNNSINNNSDVTSTDPCTPEIIGISCSSWDIKTFHSNTISNEFEMESLSTTLQNAAEPNHKKIWPPEIVFLNSLVLTHKNACNNEDSKLLEINFNAKSALTEWATAHRGLILNDGDDEEDAEPKSCRGVSVLETIDAKLWKEKRRQKQQQQQQIHKKQYNNIVKGSCFSPDLIIKTKNEFHFDWSYSTPYTGSTTRYHPPFDNNVDDSSSSSALWLSRENSGINKQMLTDRTQPILFFDDITLYEDDLHDNGEVKLSLKVRIMPNCFYILQRLFLRVDFVLVRARDVRIFHEFGTGEVMRDVTWREGKWEELSKLGLPKDIGSWMEKRVSEIVWNQVPCVDLPDDIPKYSSLSLNL